MTQSDYLNACSTAACVPFDNCARLGMCDPKTQLPATIDPTTRPSRRWSTRSTCPRRTAPTWRPNRIYMYGTSDFAPMLKAVQPLLSAETRRIARSSSTRARAPASSRCSIRPSESSATRRRARRPTTPSTSTTTATSRAACSTRPETPSTSACRTCSRLRATPRPRPTLGDDGERLHRGRSCRSRCRCRRPRRRSRSAPRRRTWCSASAGRIERPAAAARTRRRGSTRPTTSSATRAPARRC